VEQIVMADADIKQVTRRYARRIAVVILRPRRRNLYMIRTILRWGASGKRCEECWALAPTEQSSLQVLIPSEPGQVHRSCRVGCEWNCTGNHAAIVPPIETNPRPSLAGLILQMGCLIELFVVINAENPAGGRGRSPRA
jgi:hypothetical protein